MYIISIFCTYIEYIILIFAPGVNASWLSEPVVIPRQAAASQFRILHGAQRKNSALAG
jgi:hypothetical protein